MQQSLLRSFSAFLFAALAFATSATAQVPSPSRQDEVKFLRSKFSKAEVAILNASITYEFKIDKEKGLLIHEREAGTFIALKAGAQAALHSFTNSYIEHIEYSLKDAKGKKARHETYCGQQVNENIFYTDGIHCLYGTVLGQSGDILNYQLESLYNDPRYLADASFTSVYPSNRREIRFVVPSEVKVDFVEMNFAGYSIQKKKEAGAGTTTYSYSMEMVEGYPKEDHLPGPLRYQPHLLVLTREYTDKKGVSHPIIRSTADLYGWYKTLTGHLITDVITLKPLVAELTLGLKTDEEKMGVLYYWVQDNIKYIAFEDGVAAFRPTAAKDVYYNKFGDCKGMANLTKALLTTAGLDARLSWIGTDRIPYTYETPTIGVNNHMICTVVLNGKSYYLDATEKFCRVGAYGERIQGKEALVEDGVNYRIEKIPVEPIESTLEETRIDARVQETSLVATGSITYHGEIKRQVLQMLRTLSPENQRLFLKLMVTGESKPMDFSITRKPWLHRDSIARIDFRTQVPDRVFRNNKDLYVNLEFEKSLLRKKIPKERKAPFQFEGRIFKQNRVQLALPDGYKISQLPPPLQIKNALFDFRLGYEVIDNTLVYSQDIRVYVKTLLPSQFTVWNDALAALSDFYDHAVTLQSSP